MNNIFKYATKELSQDAFLCWSINWLNESSSHPLYQYGKAMLDLFLQENKQEQYYDVEIYCQYKKIDILVVFKDNKGNSHALIIEDKTNTSEHSDQMTRYKSILLENIDTNANLRKYKDPSVHLSYIKTGIMYDEDTRMVGKGATVIDLYALSEVVSEYAKLDTSEILSDFCEHICKIKDGRIRVEKQIKNGDYSTALRDRYGQFYFLDNIFNNRSKGTVIGNRYIEHKSNPPVFIQSLYSGTNNGGDPWSQYCFWGDRYSKNYVKENENEYHYLFWRIDCKWKKVRNKDEWRPDVYIALRHYDCHAHSGVSYTDERKRFVYRKFRIHADKEYLKFPHIFSEIGVRENYKESDLLYIPVDNLRGMQFHEIKEFLCRITDSFNDVYETLYCGMDDALKDI